MAGFKKIKETLDTIMGEGKPVHGSIWNNVTLHEFINTPVWGKVPIEVGKPDLSNLILALRGLPPFGTIFLPKMPKGLPPAKEEDIVLIENWIRNGCPEFSSNDEESNLTENLEVQVSDETHNGYWRSVDNFFLPGLSSPTTSIQVNRMHINSFEIWTNVFLDGQLESVWIEHLAKTETKESFEYIREHQNRLINQYYNGNQDSLFESLWKFGGSLLPEDPQSKARPYHRMNGVLDWFYWIAQLDATSRAGDISDIDLALMRAWQVGIVADGLLRKDLQRPIGGRMPITNFNVSDPDLKETVYLAYKYSTPAELRAFMLSRARDFYGSNSLS